jgi:hypothetical protein
MAALRTIVQLLSSTTTRTSSHTMSCSFPLLFGFLFSERCGFLRSVFSFLFFLSFFSNLIANCCRYCNDYYYFYCGFLPSSCALRLHVMITAVYIYIYIYLCECECVSAMLVEHIEQERHDHGKRNERK